MLYRQSDLPEVFELTWIFGCVTPKGLMNRLTPTRRPSEATSWAGRTMIPG